MKLICTRQCFAGRMFLPGDATTEEQLKAMGVPEVPAHFAPADSEEAAEVSLDADGNGFTTKDEMVAWLNAKGIHFPSSAKKADLAELIKIEMAKRDDLMA
jgi:hypothetical protein